MQIVHPSVARCVLALAGLLLLASPPAPGQGRGGAIWFVADTHDFGQIEEGDRVEHVFRFKNAGSAPIRITDVKPACGCTTPSWTEEPVVPGASGEIRAEFNSTGRPGPFRKSIEVRTSGVPVRKLLFIEGEVVPRAIELSGAVVQGGFSFEHDRHDFERIDPSTTHRHVFPFQNTGERPVRITGLDVFPPESIGRLVSVQFPTKILFPGDVAEVAVQVKPPPAGTQPAFDYALVLETNDELQPEKTLRVKGVWEASGSSGR